ncbi:MAG: PAS domain S-box protein [Methanomicrobiaceae archaeon]|nr:PAS domain S-box protein [Methanomicrobiaceae archaeon]
MLFESTSDSIFLHRVDENGMPGQFLEVNKSACESLGYTYDELCRLTVIDIAGEKGRKEAKEQIELLYKKGSHTFESSQVRSDGTVFPVEVNSHLIRTADNGDLILSVVREITERKQAEEALRRSEEQYRAIYDNSPIAIELYDAEGYLIHVNPSCLELFGVDNSDYIKGFSLFDDPNIGEEQKKILAGGKTVRYESEFDFEKVREFKLYPTSRSGKVWLNVLITPLKTTGELTSGYLIQIQDITNQRLIAEELRISEEKYRDLADNAPIGILTCDRNGRITYVNDRVPKMLGSPSVEKTIEVNLFTTTNIIKAGFADILKDVIENGSHYSDLEMEYTSIWGKKVYLRLHISQLLKGDTPEGAKLIIDDITRRRETEVLLERTQFAFDHSPDEIFFVNRDGLIVYANAHARDKFGIESNSQINTTVFDINPEFTPEKWDEIWSKLISEDYVRLESMHTDTDGTRYPVDIIKYLIKYGDGDYSCTIARDITENKKAEKALKESEGRLYTLIQTIPDLIWLKDKDGIYLACNAMFERFFGAKEREIVGKTDYDFIDKELADFFRENDRLAVEAGKPRVNEEWITFADDSRRAYLETIKTPMYNSEGKVAGVLGIGRDITERKTSEDALKEVNRKLNLLSSITRHDILNQITVAAGYLEVIKLDDEIPHGTKTEEHIDKISGAVETIKKQIIFTGYYKDLGEQAPQWFDVNETIKTVGKTSSFGDIQLYNDVKDIEVFVDPLFEKVIYNLIDNAVKHGETITKISFYAEEKTDELIIYCEDNGVGIPKDAKEKIFRREYFKNSGLGLFLSQEILAITKLSIKETGKEGVGAKFEIHVPNGKFRMKSSLK